MKMGNRLWKSGCDIDEGIGTLALNWPEKGNAMAAWKKLPGEGIPHNTDRSQQPGSRS